MTGFEGVAHRQAHTAILDSDFVRFSLFCSKLLFYKFHLISCRQPREVATALYKAIAAANAAFGGKGNDETTIFGRAF
jgi:hypothetical protein